MADRYFARSASDRFEDWPCWYVADATRFGLNVVPEEFQRRTGRRPTGLPFMPRQMAEAWAAEMNADIHPGPLCDLGSLTAPEEPESPHD